MTSGPLLLVAGEPVWPARTGGRVRMAGLAEALHRGLDGRPVVVAESGGPGGEGPGGIRRVALPPAGGSRVGRALAPGPRAGAGALGPAGRRALSHELGNARPAAILWSHSYLTAVAGPAGGRGPRPIEVADFPNVEVDRQRSFTRAGPAARRVGAALEWAKARRWEPQVARRVDLAVAVTDGDAERLAVLGARRVVVVPNATGAGRPHPSPPDGPALLVANAGYQPNRAGAERFLQAWPAVVAAHPGARLVVAGRGSAEAFAWAAALPGVDLVGEVADLAPWYAGCAVLVAPAASGGGTQLKVVEALGAGRVVAGPPLVLRSAPPGAEAAVLVADDTGALAAVVASLLADPAGRHRREEALTASGAVPTWDRAVEPLVEALARLGVHSHPPGGDTTPLGPYPSAPWRARW